jgi:acyl-CoA synthetase (NDP forming)
MDPESEIGQERIVERPNKNLEPLFRPSSIAIVGVPRGDFRFGGASYLHKFKECGFPGRIYPINPKADEIQGRKAYPTLASLPEVPDLVMVCVPAAAVLDVLQECASLGARHIHILTSGFKELRTDEGRAREEGLAAFAREKGLLVVGPNCMGPYCPAARLTAWGAIPGLPGPVGVISQSGTITQRITEYLCSLGMGTAKAVSMGNAAVLGAADYLEFMASDPEVRTVAMYLESVPDPRAFLRLAREVNRMKPLILWKGGESDVGASTAVSHTGGLAGASHLWEAFFRQSGVARVRSMEEWADTILALTLLPVPRGKGVFLVGGGGGYSVVNGDAWVRQGLDVPRLSGSTMEKLREIMPAVGNIPGNPLDDWRAYEDADHFAEVMEMGYEDPAVNLIVVDRIIPRASFHMGDEQDPTGEAIELVRKKAGRKPTVFTVDLAGGDTELACRGASLLRRICSSGVPAYPSHERAARALAHLYRYHKRVRRL